jgi:hypothetical protein
VEQELNVLRATGQREPGEMHEIGFDIERLGWHGSSAD